MNFEFNEKERAFLKKVQQAPIPYLEAPTPAVKLVALALMVEKFSKKIWSYGMNSEVWIPLVKKYGTPALQDLLSDFQVGKSLGVFCLVQSMTKSLQLISSGKQEWILEGIGGWALNPNLVDWLAVMANSEQGLVLVFFSSQTSGIIAEASQAPFYEISFKNCKVPESQLVFLEDKKDFGKNLKQWQDTLLIGLALGSMDFLFKTLSHYAKNTMRGEKPLIAYQELSFKLSELWMGVQSSKLLACQALAQGQLEVAKVFCVEWAERLAHGAERILSPKFFQKNTEVQQVLSQLKWLQWLGNTTDQSKLEIADAMLAQI